LTFQDNFKAQIQDIQITVDANGTPTSDFSFKLKDTTLQAQACIVMSCRNTKVSNSYPPTAPFIFWDQNSNNIKINNITGLVAGVAYSLKVLVF